MTKLVAAAAVLAGALTGALASPTAPGNRSAGILYEVWHTLAAQTIANVSRAGGAQLTTELVLRSNGTLTLNDVYAKYGLNGDIWNVQPQLGFYCCLLYTSDAADE
mgnify:CR=1 FL=1